MSDNHNFSDRFSSTTSHSEPEPPPTVVERGGRSVIQRLSPPPTETKRGGSSIQRLSPPPTETKRGGS